MGEEEGSHPHHITTSSFVSFTEGLIVNIPTWLILMYCTLYLSN